MNTNFEQTQTNTCKEEVVDWRSISLDEFFEKRTVDGKCFTGWFGRYVAEYADADQYHCFVIQEDEEDERMKFWLCIKKSCVTGKEMKLTVLGRYIGMVIGRGGKNIKKIAKALGLNYIKVEKLQINTRKEEMSNTVFCKTQTNESQKETLDKLFDSLQNDGICAVLRLGHKQTLPEKGKDAYFCYPFWDVPEERVSYLLLVRRSAVPQKGLVRFKVDEDIIARLIGNGGKNIKEIAKELGVNYIKVEKRLKERREKKMNANQVTNHVPTEFQKKNFEKDFKENTKDGKCMVQHLSHVLHPKEFGGDEYHYFPLSNCGDMRYWLCIRKDFIYDIDLTLKVEERYVGKVLGRGGENIKKIAKQLGLRYIRVVKA